MPKENLPILLTFVKGAVGKQFVIKHYTYGIVKTKYPDMSKITATEAQRNCRNKFKEAMAYAKTIMADPVHKKQWERKAKRKSRAVNFIIKAYLAEAKASVIRRERIASRIIRKCFDAKPGQENTSRTLTGKSLKRVEVTAV